MGCGDVNIYMWGTVGCGLEVYGSFPGLREIEVVVA